MAEATEPNGGTVRFNIKDLLFDLNQKLDKVLEKMEGKAERADVHELKGRVAALEKQAEITRVLESNRQNEATTREQTRDRGLSRIQGYVVVVTSVIAAAAIVFAALPHIHFS